MFTYVYITKLVRLQDFAMFLKKFLRTLFKEFRCGISKTESHVVERKAGSGKTTVADIALLAGPGGKRRLHFHELSLEARRWLG